MPRRQEGVKIFIIYIIEFSGESRASLLTGQIWLERAKRLATSFIVTQKWVRGEKACAQARVCMV